LESRTSLNNLNRNQTRVVFLPQSHKAMLGGIQQIVNVIRPTLGPLPRTVVNDLGLGRNPEILDSGGTIARRIIQVLDKDQDMGAMFIRHMLWKQQERCGDGTVTAAVLFEVIFREGLRYIASGGNAMILRPYYEEGLRIITDCIKSQVTFLEGKDTLSKLAQSICYDDHLAKMMGEIFDIIGAYGRLDVRNGHGREDEREYIEGMYWEGSFFSRQMANDANQFIAKIEDPAVLISNLDVENPDDLIPVLVFAQDAGFKSMLLVVRSLSEKAMSLLLAKPNREKIHVVAVKTPGVGLDTQLAAVEDLAILTGGKPLLEQTGDLLKSFKPEYFGKARKAWADKDHFGISGGKGDKRELRKHIQGLRANLAREEDSINRTRLQERIGRLMGGSATLMIGGMTSREIDFRKELAERTAEAMRGAIREGVVPGGGAALLACRSTIEARMHQSQHEDEKMAFKILLQALEEPTRVLIKNAGYNPDKILPQIDAAGAGWAFDVRTGVITNMLEKGIFDSAATTLSAVSAAIKTAALGLTTDVLVHLKNPPIEYNT